MCIEWTDTRKFLSSCPTKWQVKQLTAKRGCVYVEFSTINLNVVMGEGGMSIQFDHNVFA